MVLERLAVIDEKLARRRRWASERGEERTELPKLVDAALENPRAAAADRLEGEDGEAGTRIVEILARAAQDIRGV